MAADADLVVGSAAATVVDELVDNAFVAVAGAAAVEALVIAFVDESLAVDNPNFAAAVD